MKTSLSNYCFFFSRFYNNLFWCICDFEGAHCGLLPRDPFVIVLYKTMYLHNVCDITCTLVFGPIDIANLWNPFNRIRIIMGEFGCKQIRTSSSCTFDRKKDFFNLFFGFRIFCQEIWSAFWQRWQKKLISSVIFSAKFWGYRGALGFFFGSNVPLALLIDPWKF